MAGPQESESVTMQDHCAAVGLHRGDCVADGVEVGGQGADVGDARLVEQAGGVGCVGQ